MELELYYDTTVEPFASAGFNAARVFELLSRIKEAGITVRVYDTAGWDHTMLREVYLKACVPAILKKYGIKNIFGKRGRRGLFFGRQTPALLVVENGRVTDVYPRREGDRFVTISDFLEGLLAGLRRGGK